MSGGSWVQTWVFPVPWVAAGFGCSSVLRWANLPCLLWPQLSLLRLFYRAKSKAQAGKQISWSFWLLHSCPPALLSSGANLHSLPCAVPARSDHLGLTSVPGGGKPWGWPRWDRAECVTPAPLCRAAGQDGVVNESKLLNQRRKALSLPFAASLQLFSF